ncbi:MAG: penicillin-binding protein 2, partial [Alphaproteobacteria bacterium]|nr:penicillin-binding protein 2 [Alphaproteobacteria bacterium]
MESRSENNDYFSRRAFMIAAGQAVVLSVLAGRLAWLQIAESVKYKTLAEDNRINMRIIAPRRGYIYDRNGELLAGSRRNFRLTVTPEQTDKLTAVLEKVQKIVTVDERDIKRVLKEAKKNPGYNAIIIKDNLSWDEVSVVEVNIPTLPGVAIEMGEIRHYEMGPMTAHFLGYVGA